jgi:hypothetical protein
MQVTFWVASSANIFIFAENLQIFVTHFASNIIDILKWMFGKVLQLCGGETGGTWGINFELSPTLQRTNTENSKQIFPEKELRGHFPNFHINVSVSDLCISSIDQPILLQEICGPI